MIKRGQEVRVRRIPHAQGYVWEGYFEEHPDGKIATPIGRIRKLYRAGGLYSASVIWLDIGGYLIL